MVLQVTRLLSGRYWAVGLVTLLLPAMVWAADGDKAAVVQPSLSGLVGQVGLALGLVVLLLVSLAWLLKRTGMTSASANGQLKVIGSLSVGPRERIVLVQAGSDQLLVGVTAAEISLLHLLSEPVDVLREQDASSVMPASFAERLTQAMRQRKVASDPAGGGQ